jgi:hypothetical protein
MTLGGKAAAHFAARFHAYKDFQASSPCCSYRTNTGDMVARSRPLAFSFLGLVRLVALGLVFKPQAKFDPSFVLFGNGHVAPSADREGATWLANQIRSHGSALSRPSITA